MGEKQAYYQSENGMTISQVIEVLQKLQADFGDFVCVTHDDWRNLEVVQIEIVEFGGDSKEPPYVLINGEN